MKCEVCKVGAADRHKDLNNLALCRYCLDVEIDLHPVNLKAIASRLWNELSTAKRHYSRRLLAIAEWQEQHRGKPLPK